MARIPGLTWRPIARKERGPLRTINRINLHIAVSSTRSLWSYFNRGGTPDSHAYVLWDGSGEQYVDTSQHAYCDLQGNPDTLSIETQGTVGATQSETWTAAQCETLARIIAWAHTTHGVPLQLADDSRPGKSSHGVSWHRLGIDGNFPARPLHGRLTGGLLYSRARGKTCPGNARIRQIPGILARAKIIAATTGGGSVPPVEFGPIARPVAEVQLALAVLGYYDAGTDLQWLDGHAGPATRAAVMTYQRARGLLHDGWWGPATNTHFERTDMSKIVDQIASSTAAKVHGWRTDHINLDAWGVARNALAAARSVGAEVAELEGKIDGLIAAVSQLATGQGLDPAVIESATAAGVSRALDRVRVVVDGQEG